MLKRGQKGLRERQAMLMESQFERKKFTAEDVMIRPIFLYLEDDIETILEKLQSEEINYCVVVDEENHFIGEISDEMLLKIIANTSVNEPLVKILDI
jgi:predicted transcriptional regulator